MRKVYISTATQRYLYVLCLSSYLYARLCRVRRPVLAGRRSSDGRAPSHHKAVRTQHIYYCAPGGGGASVGGSAGCQEVRAFIKDTRPKTNTFAKVLQNLSAKRGRRCVCSHRKISARECRRRYAADPEPLSRALICTLSEPNADSHIDSH
jgi:hypothetical protein